MSEIMQLDDTYIAHTYARFPVRLVEGEGSILWDESGRRYIDLGSGIAVNTFGIADKEWQKAVTAQLGRLQHTSNLYYTGPCAHLAEMLCQRTGMKKVFFSNSGAEANECAIKAARKYAAGVFHYRHFAGQLPWPYFGHSGGHWSGRFSPGLPASAQGLCLCQARRSGPAGRAAEKSPLRRSDDGGGPGRGRRQCAG